MSGSRSKVEVKVTNQGQISGAQLSILEARQQRAIRVMTSLYSKANAVNMVNGFQFYRILTLP